MLSYDSLPKFKLSPIKSLYFRFGKSKEPYEIPYIVAGGQIYLSLEHLVALGCGTRARPASGEANNSTSPCVANIGVDAAGYELHADLRLRFRRVAALLLVNILLKVRIFTGMSTMPPSSWDKTSFLEFLRALYHVVTSAAYIPTLTHRELRGIS